MEAKIAALLALTARLTFHQAVIFCNSRPDGEYLADKLAAAGMPAAFLAGGQPQAQRMRTLGAVRGFRLRVIVSTDLVRLASFSDGMLQRVVQNRMTMFERSILR